MLGQKQNTLIIQAKELIELIMASTVALELCLAGVPATLLESTTAEDVLGKSLEMMPWLLYKILDQNRNNDGQLKFLQNCDPNYDTRTFHGRLKTKCRRKQLPGILLVHVEECQTDISNHKNWAIEAPG